MNQSSIVPVSIAAGALGVSLLVLGFGAAYTVEEGHVGVVTHWGQAVAQESPAGLQFKMPIVTGIREFDVREKRTEPVPLSAATANQLPITAAVSMSWRLDPTNVLGVYQNFGGPAQFESTVIQPRLQQAAKAGLSQYQASDLIRDRTGAAEAIRALLVDALDGYPAIILSVQIEDVQLPPRYLEAVMAKEEAREAAEKEKYNLERQKVEAQRGVQTAQANRDAAMATADGEAYRIKTEATARAEATELQGRAEAAAIEARAGAISQNPSVIALMQAEKWDGVLPGTMVPGGALPFIDVGRQ